VELECTKLTNDVASKLLNALKQESSEESALNLIGQAFGYFKQNYDQIQNSHQSVLPQETA